MKKPPTSSGSSNASGQLNIHSPEIITLF